MLGPLTESGRRNAVCGCVVVVVVAEVVVVAAVNE